MEREEFLKEITEKMDIILSNRQAEQFYEYMLLLLDWNQKINLTAITEPNDIIVKHFVDCATIAEEIDNEAKVIDVGTGAGFPGIPLKILKPDLSLCLVDSLNKRITFLLEVMKKLELKKVEIIHSRAEELGREKAYREQFDISVSRAVAPLNVLLEYVSPFVKVGGEIICMKGSNSENELKEANKALRILGVVLKEKREFNLPGTNIGRSILSFDKKNVTPKTYPRKPGTPKNKPII